jgi:hypothetical protein
MQPISESAESLFGDLHKPFSTASVKSGRTQAEHIESALGLKSGRQGGHVDWSRLRQNPK